MLERKERTPAIPLDAAQPQCVYVWRTIKIAGLARAQAHTGGRGKECVSAGADARARALSSFRSAAGRKGIILIADSLGRATPPAKPFSSYDTRAPPRAQISDVAEVHLRVCACAWGPSNRCEPSARPLNEFLV